MKVFLIIMMFVTTVYSIQNIIDQGKVAKVGKETVSRHLSNVACIAIATITIALDLAYLYVLAAVV